MFSDFPLSILTFVKYSLIILMTSGKISLSGLSSGVYLRTAWSKSGYRPSRVVGLVRYPLSSSLRDSGLRSVSFNHCQYGSCLEYAVETVKETYIDEFLESRIGTFFLFKLVLTKQLMSTISDERLEMRSSLQEQISDILYDGLLFLPFRQAFRQDLIDIEYFVDVPKDLTDEIVSPVRRHHLLRT